MADKKKANSLSIYDVLKDHGVDIQGSGDNLKAISPFRASNNMNSFTVSLSRNTFRDWKLDIGGGPVKFIAALLEVSEDDAASYLVAKYFEGGGEALKPKLFTPPKKVPIAPLDPQVLDKAYRIFLSLCNVTNEDLKYLRDERHLSAEEIEGFQLKSFPLRTIRSELHASFLEAGVNPQDVPGIYQYVDDANITFSRYVGVIIPIKDVSGKIIGLQIRKRKLKDEFDNRYVWFSSSFAQNKVDKKPEFVFPGRSPESPLGFVPGTFSDRGTRTLFITEGFFKALAIRKILGAPSITVQGVTNWKNLNKYIEELMATKYRNLSRIVFALDADFISNLNVSSQMCKMWVATSEQFPALTQCTMLWDMAEGKGIDDLLANVGKEEIASHIRLMPMVEFKKRFEDFLPFGKELISKEASDAEFIAAYQKYLN